MTATVLASMLTIAEANLTEMQADNADNKYDAAITREQNNIDELKTAIIAAVTSGNVKTSQHKDYEAYHMKNSISDQLRTVPKFRGTGPRELNQFLEKLKQAYDMCVIGGKHEDHFVRCAKLALSEDIYSSLCSSKAVVNTFDDLKKWLCEAFDSQLTSFQLLGSAFGAEYNSTDKFITFAQKIEKEVRTARNVIKAEHKRKHSEDMTADQVFDLMGAMLMVEKLQAHHKSIYDAMVDKMNDLRTASDVATKAECLRDRCKGESLAPTEQSFYGGSKPQHKSNGKSQQNPLLTELQKSNEQQQQFNRQVLEFMKSSNGANQDNKGGGPTKSNYNSKPHKGPIRKPPYKGKKDEHKKPAATQNKSYVGQEIHRPSLGDIMGDSDFQ